MATNDLTTLADVKAWLSIQPSDATFDPMLTRLITACSMFMQSYMNRILAVSSYSYTFNGNGRVTRTLVNYPIQSVTAVSVDGTAVPAGSAAGPTTAQQAGYYFDSDTVYLRGWAFSKGIQNCSVSYTAGLPPTDPTFMSLAQACIETVSLRFKERGRIGEVSKSVNGEVISFTQKDFPDDVVTLMNNLRNVVPVEQ